MDTLHFDSLNFKDHEPRRIDRMNLSEVEVFMLRGRRLQAQAIGEGLRKGFARLRHLLGGFHPGAASQRHPGSHRCA